MLRFSKKREEKKKLETDITELTAEKERITHEVDDVLRDSTITIKAINEYAHFREELNKHGLSVNDLPRLVLTLSNLKKEGYNTGKIIARASMIETLENQVQGLDQRCGMLKSKGAIYQEAFQTCEQLASTGINILQMELPVLFNAIRRLCIS
jgi:chromosome segregation ATPase